MHTATTMEFTTYNMKVPLLNSGRTTDLLVRTENSTVMAKVYSEGGENALHAHVDEDHTFFILDGEATFYREDEKPIVVGKYEGIMISAGVYYRFEATSAANLVMIRFGAKADRGEEVDEPGGHTRVGPDGDSLEATDPRNKSLPPVFSGETFGVD